MDSSFRLYKRRAIQLNQQSLKQEAFRNQLIREARNKRLELLALNNQPDLSKEVDMDIVDLQDYKFEKNDLVEVYTRRFDRIQYASVEQVLDELIQIKYYIPNTEAYQQNQIQWFSKDTDKLYMRNTYNSQQRVRNFKLIRIQVRYLELINQQFEKLRRE